MRVFLILLVVLGLGSCKVFKSNLMFKTPHDFNYDKLIDSLSRIDYKIAPNDAVVYRVFTNDGFRLIDLAASGSNNVFRTEIDAIVESDGSIKLPLIGRLTVAGLSIKEAENMFEEKFSKFYVNPYVNLRVNNKRVVIFPGNSGIARVIALSNNNTTVLEALASAGGITDDGKAYKVKLIRNNPDPSKKPYVYLMDLSSIEGVTLANSKVQNNDVIYVEPRYRPLKTFSNEIAPIITLVTSFLLLYQFYRFR